MWDSTVVDKKGGPVHHVRARQIPGSLSIYHVDERPGNFLSESETVTRNLTIEFRGQRKWALDECDQNSIAFTTT